MHKSMKYKYKFKKILTTEFIFIEFKMEWYHNSYHTRYQAFTKNSERKSRT